MNVKINEDKLQIQAIHESRHRKDTIYYPIDEDSIVINGKVLSTNQGNSESTRDLLVDVPSEESISGTAYNQKRVNTEVVNNISNIASQLSNKQEVLVSGQNIKTINNQSILGNGDIHITGGSDSVNWGAIGGNINNQTDLVSALNLKQNTEKGKGLSTNDYTSAEKSKLNSITEGAEVNVINTIKVNNTALTPTGKTVNIGVPTKTSDINNDSGFITNSALSGYATKGYVDNAVNGKQDTINDLATIRTNAQAGKTASDNLGGHTVGKNVPSDAVFTDTVYDDTEVRGLISTETTRATNTEDQIAEDVAVIESKIPTQASTINQLADKEFVNSSVATNTANYISDDGEPFTSVSDLPTSCVTNNDYAFVTGTDAEGNTYYDRYKATVSGSTVSWAKEYRLNNSSFTAVQWAAITSGITAALVGKLDALPTNSQLTTLLAGKADTSDIPTQLSQLSDDSTHRTVTDTEKSTWNNKSDFSGDYNDLTNKPTIPSIQGLATETYVNNAVSPKANSADVYNKTYIDGIVNTVEAELDQKQATLVSGTNIKTVNSQSILGEGNITVGTVTSEVYKQTEYPDYFSTIPDGVVDLGLPSGLLWAKCNLGANTETGLGDYFAFGETTPRAAGWETDAPYDWAHAPFNNGSSSYNSSYFTAHKSEWFNDDVLKPEYDAVTVNMGTGWRMPTMADFEELLSDTNNEWVENYNGTDINGYKFTNKSDASKYIFIPASGFRDGSSVRYVDSRGIVWSSSLGSSSLSYAQYLDFDGSDIYVDETHRRHGRSVRGVYNPNN